LKLFVFLLAIFAGIWLWKRNRIAAGKTNDPAKGTSKPMACDTGPQAMLACQHCGVHLPSNEAIAGQHGGVYCSAEHRAAAHDA
jgi:uncharacterized protein